MEVRAMEHLYSSFAVKREGLSAQNLQMFSRHEAAHVLNTYRVCKI